jgi:SAM-dependent methyltransferase
MKDSWNRVFDGRKNEFSHERCLEEDIIDFKRNRLLDLGSGDGRNAFYFDRQGFDVTCLDYSEVGIKKIQNKAKSFNSSIRTIVSDVYIDNLDYLRSSFDTIAMVHFFPNIDVLEVLMSLLSTNGILYCNTFIKDKYIDGNRRFEIGISQKEIEKLKNRFKLIKDKYTTDPRGDFYSFVLQTGDSK